MSRSTQLILMFLFGFGVQAGFTMFMQDMHGGLDGYIAYLRDGGWVNTHPSLGVAFMAINGYGAWVIYRGPR